MNTDIPQIRNYAHYDTEEQRICIVSKNGAQRIECHHKDIYIPLTPQCDLRQYAVSQP